MRWVSRLFYGWWIVAASFVLNALSSGFIFSGFSIFFVPLREEFGWSRTLLSGGMSLLRVESAFLGPIEGWIIDKIGPRIVVLIGVVLLGGGFMAFSRMDSVFWFYFSFVILALGSSMAGFLPLTTTIAHWFVEKRGLAMGIAMTGIGLGGALIVGFLAWGVAHYGWRATALASGVFIWLVGIPTGLVLRHKPEEYGHLPDGKRPFESSPQKQGAHAASPVPPSALSRSSDQNVTARAALRTPAFWLICFGQGSALLVIGAVLVHQVQHMVQRMQLSLEAAAGFVSLGLMVSVAGQLMGGYLADRLDKRRVLALCMLGHMVGVLMLAFATTIAPLVFFVVVHGLANGVRNPTITALFADYFGRKSYATIVGFYSVFVMLTSTISPIFAGWLADVRGGSYVLPFTILAVWTGIASLFFLLLPPLRRAPAARRL